jgi:hypothetical protein
MEWISIDDRMPNIFAGKFKVRLKNGNETNAYYYQDKLGWISFYGHKTSHWWESTGHHKRLDDVTHWMPLPKPPQGEIN